MFQLLFPDKSIVFSLERIIKQYLKIFTHYSRGEIMCNQACIQFGKSQLSYNKVNNKNILEVGSFNVNGSLRAYVEDLEPLSYVLSLELF